MKMREFLKTKADRSTKSLAIICWALLGLMIITITFNCISSRYGDIRKITFYKYLLGNDVESFDKEFEQSIDSNVFLDDQGRREARELLKSFSFKNLEDYADITGDYNMDQITEFGSLYFKVILIASLVCIALTLIAVLLKSRVITVISGVLSVIPLMLCHHYLIIAAASLHIALLILLIIINKKYKSER